MVSGLNSFTNNLGTLLGLCLGLVVPVQYYAFPLCCPSLVFLLLCWRLPESPVWLMRRGREEEARLTLAWLRGGKYDIEPEVEELRSIITEEQNSSGTSVLEMLKKRTFVLPLILSCTLFMFQAMSGTDILSYYNGVIFKDVGFTSVFLCCLPLPCCMTNGSAANSPPIQSIICCVVQC